MSSNDYNIQISIKSPAGTLINLPANNPAEITNALSALRDLAADIVSTEQILAAAHAAAPVLNVPAQQSAAVPATSGAGAPPPVFTPAAPAATAPGCPHGPRVWRTGESAKGPWGAWFCPTPRNTPGQCDPEWDRQYGK